MRRHSMLEIYYHLLARAILAIDSTVRFTSRRRLVARMFQFTVIAVSSWLVVVGCDRVWREYLEIRVELRRISAAILRIEKQRERPANGAAKELPQGVVP